MHFPVLDQILVSLPIDGPTIHYACDLVCRDKQGRAGAKLDVTIIATANKAYLLQ